MVKKETGLVDQYNRPIRANPKGGPPRRRIDNWFVNQQTGLGTAARDKTLGVSTMVPHISDQDAESIYISSALAAKVVNIPVEDALMRWRTFEGEDAEAFRQAEKEYRVKIKLAKAAKDARVYGTALVIMAIADDAWDKPLYPERIRPGMLRNLIVVDKRAISHVNLSTDLLSTRYGEAESYDVTLPRSYQTYKIHASRVLRFDGLISNSERDFYTNDRWALGISVFVRLWEQLQMLSVSLQSLAHLETEAGMPVFLISGYDDVISNITPGSGEGTVQNKIEEIVKNRSLFYTTIMDAEDEYQRLNVSFDGRASLLAEYKSMFAAATDIPETRLFGRAPHGLNATGESDARNYSVKIAEVQENDYDPQLSKLDIVLAYNSGIQSPPPYKWKPLLDLSETEQVANRSVEMETLMKANAGKPIMTQKEARYQYSTMHDMEWLDDGPMPEELMAPDPAAAAAEMAALGGGAPPPMPPLGGDPFSSGGGDSGGGGGGGEDLPSFEGGDEIDDAAVEEQLAAELEAEGLEDVIAEPSPQRFGYRQLLRDQEAEAYA